MGRRSRYIEMTALPLVSVIMPVYNGERYVRQAIQSVLEQTHPDFELIIVNDGSTDRSEAVIKGFSDPRIVHIAQDHQGLISSLNKGIAIARGDYIARMDSDDICIKDRLAKQVAFLNWHSGVAIVGTGCEVWDYERRVIETERWPTDDLEIRWALLLKSPFAHPTVMIRKTILWENQLRYNESFEAAEDYDLWARLLTYGDGANLDEPLVRYRRHRASVTNQVRSLQLANHDAIALRMINRELPSIPISVDEIRGLREVFVEQKCLSDASDGRLAAIFNLYLALLEAYGRRYAGHAGLKGLRRQESLKMARALLLHTFSPGWIVVVHRLFQGDRSLPWLICVTCARAFKHRLVRWYRLRPLA